MSDRSESFVVPRVSKAWVPVLILLLALTSGCGDTSATQATASTATGGNTPADDEKKEDEEAPIAVRVQPVARAAVSELYATSATLRADKQATVTSRTSGVVKQLLVEEGEWVDSGATLAVLEDDEQRIEQEKAAFTRDTKLREFERAERLHQQGLMSDEEFGTIRREAEEARQTAEMAQLLLERTRIRAPFSGRVIRRHLDVGNTVASGAAFYDIADLEPLYADVNVPERHVTRLRPGQHVRVLADADTGRADARIERIAPAVDPATGTIKVTLAVPGSKGLRPGSFVRVEVVTDTHADALVIPRSALVAEGRRWHIFRVDGEGRGVERLEVVRGFEDGARVEVLETLAGEPPLDLGDRVVSIGASALNEESLIRIVDTPEGQDAETEGDGTDRVAT